MRTKFGGLNTVSGQLALPENDSPSLLNVDFDIGGGVKKRNGTLTLFKDEPTLNPVFISRFVTVEGYEFIISKFNKKLRVLDLQNDVVTKLWERDNVFKSDTSKPFSVPLDNNFNLLLCEKQAPIQVRFDEVEGVAIVDGSIVLQVGVSWVNTFTDCVVYVNGVRIVRTVGYSSGNLTVTSASIVVGATIHVCTFSWQWWAESLIWFGDNFYQRVSRFGASEEDKHVQVPNSIVTDEIPDSSQYGVFAYISDAFGKNYTYKSNNQPQISVEYSFSDGSNYTPSAEAFTSPSKFFITFGDITSVNTRTFTDKDVVGNQIRIVNHKLKDYDIINFSNVDGALPTGLSESVSYFVKKIDDDFIELYTDVTLTTIVALSARNFKNFTDLAIDYTDNFIAITAHGFVDTQPIRFTSTNTLPTGLSENTTYYVSLISANAFSVYFDQNLRKKVIFVYRTELFFNSTNVASDVLNIAQHQLFTGDAVRVKTTNGTLPATLNATSVYYVLVLTAGAIKLYSDSALTTVVPNYTGLTGDVFLYLDGGTHTVVADGLTTTAERVAYDAVSFLRLRQLRFNNKKGVLNSNLNVYVGNTLVDRSISTSVSVTQKYYTHETETLTPYTGSATVQKFVSFSASTPIGVRKDDYVTLVNTETRWCGSAAINTKYNFDNGSYVPAYGFGDYANYDAGEFPLFGALYQSRLCLGGVGSSVLVSAIYDKIIKDAPYLYFQVTDDLSNPTLDPFIVRVPFSQSDTVTAIRQWQQFLFIFTRSTTYKSTLDQNNQFSVNTPTLTITANIGCVGRGCVETTESTLFFLSENGVFDLGIVATNEYRASEISLPIRNVIKEFSADAQFVYDTFNNKLYVYDERLMVFFTDQKVWSEYTAVLPWDITSLVFWREYVLLCCKTLCDFQLLRTEFADYIDFAKRFVGGDLLFVQPCATNVDMYADVYDYESPLPLSPVTGAGDLTILKNGVNILEGVDWIKKDNEHIRLVTPIDGVLTFFYNESGTYNGAVLIKDSVIQSLNNFSLGLVSPNNICQYVPYTGDGGVYAENLNDFALYAAMTVNYTDLTTFSVAFTDYLSRAALISSGVFPPVGESKTFTDTFTTLAVVTTSTSPTVKLKDVGVNLSVSKSYVGTICIDLEVWYRTASIPLSVLNTFVGEVLDGAYANTSNPTRTHIFNGNPETQTVIGTLQANGLYKTTLSCAISLDSGSEPTYFIKYVISPRAATDPPTSPPLIVYYGGDLVDPSWSCSGGVCSIDPVGIYSSQAVCEAAILPPPFAGGQCSKQYIVRIDYTDKDLMTNAVFPEMSTSSVFGPVLEIDTGAVPAGSFAGQHSVWVKAYNAFGVLTYFLFRTTYNPLLVECAIVDITITAVDGVDNCGSLPGTCPI